MLKNVKNKKKNFVWMKTNNFILQKRRPKHDIKVGTENIFYLRASIILLTLGIKKIIF
jgi:hypothetical protein